MKSNRTNRFLGLLRRFFSASAIVMSFLGAAQAGNLYWDGGTTDAADPGNGSSFGGAGTWNATTKNWDNGTIHQAWANATTDTAVFGGAASGVVTLGTAVTANALTFNTAGYTVSGANILTLAGTTPTITATTDATIGSVIAGTVGLAKAGAGILTLSGANTYTGATTITAGTLTLGTGAANGTFGTGTYAISDGATLRMNSLSTAIKPAWANISGTAASTFSLRSAGNGDWAQAALPATFLGKLRIESGRVYASATAGTNTYGLGVPSSIEVLPNGQLGLWQAAGTLTQNMSIAGTGYGEAGYEAAIRLGATTLSGTITLAGSTTLGVTASTTAILTNGLGQSAASDFTAGTTSLTGTIELRGVNTYTGNTIMKSGGLIIGSSAGTSSASIYGGSIVNQLTLTGGTLRLASTGVPHTISGTVGGTGGNINVSGATTAASTLNVVPGATMTPNQLVVGDTGIGNYVQTGGSVTTGNGGNFWLANNPGGNGSTATISGGTLNGGTGTSVLGVRGSYVFTVSGSAAVTMGTLQLGHSGGTNNNPSGRIINLNGGSLTLTNGITFPVSGNNSAAVVNLSGTTLRAAATTATFWDNSLSVTANIGASPVTFDTQAFNTTIGQPLLHSAALGATADGGIIKTGTGTLTLAAPASYTGPTTVGAGSLSINEVSSTNGIVVSNGAALAITGTTGATITVPSLTLGSTAAGTGTSLSLNNLVGSTSVPLIHTANLTTNGVALGSPRGVTVNVIGSVPAGLVYPAKFPLIQSDNPYLGDGFDALQLGTVPRNLVGAALDDSGDGFVSLKVNSYTPTTWVGNAGSTWDINTSTTWKIGAATGQTYLDTDIVLFDDSADGSGAVTVALSSPTAVMPAAVIVANPLRDYAISGTGIIAGTTGITKSGAGMLTLATANTFSGVVKLDGGTLKVGNAAALGAIGALSGTTVAAGAVLDLNGFSIVAETLTLNGTGIAAGGVLINSSTTAVSTAAPITFGSVASVMPSAGALTLSGAITMNGAATFGGTANLTLSGPIAAGANPLTLTGSGTVTVSSAITGTASSLTLSGNGPTSLSGASNLGTGNIAVGGIAATTITNAITSSGSLAKSGAGTLTLSARQAYTGGTTINGGVIDLTGGGGTGGTIRGTVNVNPTGTLRISTGDATGYSLGTDRLTSINVLGGNLHVNTTGNQTLGAAALTMQGGTLTGMLGSNLDFFTENNADPLLRSSFTTLASATTSVVSGLRLKMRQNDGVVFTIADGAAPIDLDVQSNIASDAFPNNQLVKNGLGTMWISGLSTYAYPTVVNGGTLMVPATQSSTGYTLADGTTLTIIGTPGSTFSTATAVLGSAGATTVNVLNFGGQPLPANAPVRLTTSLALNSALTLNVNGVFPAAGVYPLVSFPAGSISGSGTVALGSLPPNVTATLEETATAINLNISEVNPLVWSGTVSGGVWDVNNTANWVPIAASPLGKYLENMVVLLDDSAADTTVALNSVVTPSGVTVNNPTKPYTIAGTGGISGTGPLTKTGAGLLTLATANTYIGTTTISGGTLQLGNGVIDGSIAGAIVNNASLVAKTIGTQTLPGAISGTGPLTKQGAGTLTLANDNTYTGATAVTLGTLRIGAGGFTGALAGTSAVTLGAGTTVIWDKNIGGNNTGIANSISGSGDLVLQGYNAVNAIQVGVYELTGNNSALSGRLILNRSLAWNNNTPTKLGTAEIIVQDRATIAFNGGSFTNKVTLENGAAWHHNVGGDVVIGAIRLEGLNTLSGNLVLNQNTGVVLGDNTGANSAIGGWSLGNHDLTGVISGPGEFSMSRYTAWNGGTTQAVNIRVLGSSSNTYTGKTVVDGQGANASMVLGKTGGAVAIQGGTTVQFGTGTGGQANLRMLQNEQFGTNNGGVVMSFVNASGQWGRFDLQGTTQTLAGLVGGTATTASSGIIQNRAIGDGYSNWGTCTLTLNGTGNYLYNGYIRDTDNGVSPTNLVALLKTGTGAQTLVGGNLLFTGPTTVAAGSGPLTLIDTTGWVSPTFLSPGTTLNLNRSAAGLANRNKIGGLISGTGTININNAVSGIAGGWTTFNSAVNGLKDFTGILNVNSGVLAMDATAGAWTNSTPTVNVASGGLLGIRAQSNVTVSSLNGAGDVGNFHNSTQTLTVGSANGSGSFSGVIHGNNTAAATDGALECGFVNLVKIGTGTQTLSGVNTYAGTTTINGGTLALSGAGSISASSAVTIASGAVLDVSATAGFTQATGKTLIGGRTSGTGNDLVGNFTTGGAVNVAGYGTVGTLTVSGDLSLTGGGTLQLDLSGSAVSGNDQIVAGGALNLTDAGVTTVAPVFTGAPVVGTAYPIIAYTGAAPVGTGTFVASLPAGSGITGATFDTSVAGKVLMTLAGETKALVWSGATAGVWSTDANQLNWNAPTATNFRNLDSVQFLDIAATATMTVNVGNTGNLTATPASILVNNTTTAYTFATTAAGVIAGGATLTKTGTGLLQISNANTFSGGVVVKQGSLQTGNNTAAGTGAITLGDASTAGDISWKWNGGGTPANPVVVSALGTGTVTLGTYSAGTSTIHSGPMTLNRPVILSDGANDRTSFYGKISGTVGTITLASTSAATKRITFGNAANDFVGTLVIPAGIIYQSDSPTALPITTSVSNAGTYQLNTGGIHTVDSVNGAGGISIIAGGATTLSIGNNGGSSSISGIVANNTAALSLIKNGAGSLTLSNANTNTGTTQLKGGTTFLTNSLALGGSTLDWNNYAGTLNLGTLTTLTLGALQGAQDFTMKNAAATPIDLTVGGNNGTTFFTGALLGGTTFTKTGTGTMHIGGTAPNTYTGLTTVANGNFGLSKPANVVAIPGSITMTNNEGVRIFTTADNQFAPGCVLTLNGGTGNSRFELLGTTQTFAGLVNDATGRGVVQTREQVTTPNVTPLSTLILDVPALATPSYNGYLRNNGGTMAVTKNGLGTQVFAGANILYTGRTTINAGTLAFATANVGRGPVTVNNTGTLQLNAGNTTDSLGSITINAGGVVNTFDTGAVATAYATNLVNPLTMNGGLLSGPASFFNATYGTYVLGTTLTVGGTSTSRITGSVHMANARTMDVGVTGDASGIDLDIPGQLGNIEGATWGTLNKTGAGTLRISNPANLLGGVTINTGKVIFKDVMAGLANTGLVNNSIVDADMGTAVSAIFAGPMTGTGVFNKIGGGTLTRTGGGAFAGNINVKDGKLAGKIAGAFGATANTRTITVAAGKTLEFQIANVFGNHGTTAAPIVVEADGTVTNADPGATGKVNNGLGNLTLNSATLTATVGNGISLIDAATRPGEGYGVWGLNGTVTSTGNSSISAGPVTGMGGRVLLSSTAADTVFNVVSGTLTVAAPLQRGDSATNNGLTKTGAGTLALTAANLYTGNTTVNAGTLELADNAQLKFVLGGASDVNNRLTGAGTAVLNGDFVIDTTAANGLATGSSWTLENVTSLTGAYGSTFQVVGFKDAGDNKWTKGVAGMKKYTFDEVTGVLTLGDGDSYASWIDEFFPGETNPAIIGATADPDHDGILNAVEMVLGGNPKDVMDAALLPTIELVTNPVSVPAIPAGDYLLFTYRRSQRSVTAGVTAGCETDPDLVPAWTAATGAPGVVIQVDDNFAWTNPVAGAATDRVRVYVPRAANTKLFGRLNVAP